MLCKRWSNGVKTIMTEPRTKSILVIDDDPSLQDLVKTMLSRFDYRVITALTVAQGVAVLRSGALPDLVLLDLMLPDVDGFELLRQIRATRAFDALPVIILSSMADPVEIKRGLELGADRYVTKPTLRHNLVTAVQDVLRTGRKVTGA
jgi:DNA-binding response OmpR family regulator